MCVCERECGGEKEGENQGSGGAKKEKGLEVEDKKKKKEKKKRPAQPPFVVDVAPSHVFFLSSFQCFLFLQPPESAFVSPFRSALDADGVGRTSSTASSGQKEQRESDGGWNPEAKIAA